jgi:glc operon protein GlcG
VKVIRTIDYQEAKRIIDAIVERADGLGKSAVVAVADCHGELIAFSRMDGAPVSSIRIAVNKAWSAARERKATKEIGERARHPEKGFEIAYFGDPQFVGWPGGVPVWRNNEVVGAVAVSGLPSEVDVELATFGASLVEDYKLKD